MKASIPTALLVLLASLLSTPALAGSTSLARIVEPLKSKAEQIVSECGSRVVSTDHRGGVTPLHPHHRAVDIQGNPDCIYRLLKHWPGGVSTDYWSAPGTRHVHISYCPPHHCDGLRPYEWGLRFVHGHHSSRTVRREAPLRSAVAPSSFSYTIR